MNASSDPEKIAAIWSPEARAELLAIDRETAMQILFCLNRYLANRNGDVKKLKPPLTGFRLRCGNYRLFFDQQARSAIQVTGVRDRKQVPLN